MRIELALSRPPCGLWVLLPEVDTMTDTAALDAYLAEHLFGITLLPEPVTRHAVPEYSTTGDGMLMVLEAMRERGHDGQLGVTIDSYRQALFSPRGSVLRSLLFGFRSRDWTTADTLPLAVAQAARAALEAEA